MFAQPGANLESKALIAALAFEHLGLDRITAWANTRNGRSQLALERAGFVRLNFGTSPELVAEAVARMAAAAG